MSASPRPLAVLVATVLMVATGSACGSNPPSEAKEGGSGSAAAKEVTARDKAVKFAECVRGNGVRDFPDPNSKGEFVYGVSVTPAVFDGAVEACKDLQPPGSLSVDRTPEQQSAGLEFADCVRENGVTDFPDPAKGEALIDTTRIPSTDTVGGMTILDAAVESCRNLLDAAAASQ